MNPAAVERFVRDTLGCRCPDELFRDLRAESPNEIHDGAILVGGRLLVLVLRRGELTERLLPLLSAGRSRRDSQGFNRLRLVAVTEESACSQTLQQLFNSSPLRDERTHLHIVASCDIPTLE